MKKLFLRRPNISLVRYFILSIGLLISACSGNDAVGQWDGEYTYNAFGGHTGGGSPITMKMTLIKQSRVDKSCLLHVVGFQRLETIICTTTDHGNKLEIKFKSYDDGRIVNAIDVSVYKVGDTLFVLERSEAKDMKPRYMPRWVSYMVFDDMSKANEPFEKTK